MHVRLHHQSPSTTANTNANKRQQKKQTQLPEHILPQTDIESELSLFRKQLENK